MKKIRSNKIKLKSKSTSLRELPLIKIESLKLTKRVEKKVEKKKGAESNLREGSLINFPKPKPEWNQRPKKRSNSVSNLRDIEGGYQLDKRQRFQIYMRRLAHKPAAKNVQEAIDMINNTLVEIEDKYAPHKDNKFYAMNSKKYGRMYPVPEDRIKLNPETGITELYTVGLIVYIYNNGSFEIWTIPRGGNVSPTKMFWKNGTQ